MPALLEILNDAYTRKPSPAAAYFSMGLSALSFLDVGEYGPALSGILAGATVKRIPPVPPFQPAVLIVSQAGFYWLAIMGTRGITQWVNFVTGAGVTRWPAGRGQVFTPFFDAEQSIVASVLAEVPAGDVAFITGHSLGGAVAPMLAVSLQEAGRRLAQVYQFAAPNFCDWTWRSNYGIDTFSFNHPLDPVPLLPPDVVTLLGRDPFSARWQYGIGGVVPPRWGPASQFNSLPHDGPDWIAAMVASSLDLTVSPHNTYRYLKELQAVLSLDEKGTWRDFSTLLESLGLLAPWPA